MGDGEHPRVVLLMLLVCSGCAEWCPPWAGLLSVGSGVWWTRLGGACGGEGAGWLTPVGLGEKSSALVEVCCMTLLQHSSTKCDPAGSTGCGHWLMLRKCLRSALLFYV